MKEVMVFISSYFSSQFLLCGRIFGEMLVIHSLARRIVRAKFAFYRVIAVFIKMFHQGRIPSGCFDVNLQSRC